jgi:hypothetical protein
MVERFLDLSDTTGSEAVVIPGLGAVEDTVGLLLEMVINNGKLEA